MLAAEGRQTPRPRPPAQIRRSPSRGLAMSPGAPPPPYALEFPSLHEGVDGDTSDPVLATAKMLGIELEEELELSPTTLTSVSQKSREELTNLVLQAEKIIRAREAELSLAANLGKTLLETNEALKLRHDALLSRLPVMQSQPATFATPPRPSAKRSQADAWTTDEEVPPSSLRSRAGSVISTHSCASSVSGPPTRRGHARRISASPSALVALSETNAELIVELTRLRTSTDAAQVDGARRLRNLEREINGLKAELDTSQRTYAELEERVREQQQDEERKREHEERLKKLRATDDIHDQDSDPEIRDFAPQGQGMDAWDSVATTPRMSRRTPAPIDTELTSDSEAGGPHSAYDASVSSAVSSRAPSQCGTISPGEYAVVAQLYRKVEELQEANKELGARNRITNERLARAERNALEIKRVYDEIGEEIGAEADAEQSDGADSWRGTIRGEMSPVQSLRSPRSARSITPRASTWSLRNGNGVGLGLGDPFLEETPMNKSRRGTRGLGNKHMSKSMRTFRSRKPLTDTLFAPPVTQDAPSPTPSIVLVPSSSPRSRTKAKGKAKSRPKALSRFPSPSGSLAVRRDFSGSSRMSSSSGLTPAPSTSSHLTTSSFASLAHYVGRRAGRRSLGSELGDEFGADWGLSPELARQSTLFNDESLQAENYLYEHEHEQSDAGEEDEEEDPALAALREALTPPNVGRLLEEDEHILPVGALRSSPGEAFQIVSHAVALRPNRWLESDDQRAHGQGPRGALMNNAFFAAQGEAEDPWETTRYPEIEPGAQDEGERPNAHMHSCRRRERALERMASTRRASQGQITVDLDPSSPQLQTTEYDPPRGVVEKIKRTSADALIELWIFLQFVIVICTFVYTMSRRGPREVLRAPPRRA